MKLSPVHILFLLIFIVAASVYFGQKQFENETVLYSRGADVTNGAFQLEAQPAILPQTEGFVGRSDVPTVVPVTSTAYDAISLKQRSDMLKDIQSLVRNELLAARQLERLKEKKKEVEEEWEEEEEGQESRWNNSQADLQGMDFNRRCNKTSNEEEYRCPKNPDGSCPPVPDLSNYIRKDKIPCWGCSIDY